jgi:hypothetical protein
MSRLSPLIVRRVGPMAAALPFAEVDPVTTVQAIAWLDNLRLFATGWVGGFG